MKLTLVSHALCPYVQRAAIAMMEKSIAFERRVVDLAYKPCWFLQIWPLSKTPVLVVGETAIFESAVILEYLEETGPKPLHPADALRRAEHRSWIEFGSAILNDIAGFYNAKDAAAFEVKRLALEAKFAQIEDRLAGGPFFDGAFTLVDAVFGPVFRYFDVFDRIADFGIFAGLEKCQTWRKTLAARESVRLAVGRDYNELLRKFLIGRRSHLSSLMCPASRVKSSARKPSSPSGTISAAAP